MGGRAFLPVMNRGRTGMSGLLFGQKGVFSTQQVRFLFPVWRREARSLPACGGGRKRIAGACLACRWWCHGWISRPDDEPMRLLPRVARCATRASRRAGTTGPPLRESGSHPGGPAPDVSGSGSRKAGQEAETPPGTHRGDTKLPANVTRTLSDPRPYFGVDSASEGT